VAAWVPANHEWLQNRPLGKVLISALGKHDFQLLFMYVPADHAIIIALG
jgi:fucokinase